jgi:hypothetical protein
MLDVEGEGLFFDNQRQEGDRAKSILRAINVAAAG